MKNVTKNATRATLLVLLELITIALVNALVVLLDITRTPTQLAAWAVKLECTPYVMEALVPSVAQEAIHQRIPVSASSAPLERIPLLLALRTVPVVLRVLTPSNSLPTQASPARLVRLEPMGRSYLVL